MPWDFSDARAKDVKLGYAVRHASQPMAQAKDIIVTAMKDNFAGEWDGTEHWQQLAPRTVEDRIRKGFPGSHPILERTGRLKNSINGDSNSESAEGYVDGRIPYAEYLNDGTSKMPARPYLAISAKDEERIEEAIWEHLEQNEG